MLEWDHLLIEIPLTVVDEGTRESRLSLLETFASW